MIQSGCCLVWSLSGFLFADLLAEVELNEDVKMDLLVDDINAYSFQYPMELPKKKFSFKWCILMTNHVPHFAKVEAYMSSLLGDLHITHLKLEILSSQAINNSFIIKNLPLQKCWDFSKFATLQ